MLKLILLSILHLSSAATDVVECCICFDGQSEAICREAPGQVCPSGWEYGPLECTATIECCRCMPGEDEAECHQEIGEVCQTGWDYGPLECAP